jgi:hypothetical protein
MKEIKENFEVGIKDIKENIEIEIKEFDEPFEKIYETTEIQNV